MSSRRDVNFHRCIYGLDLRARRSQDVHMGGCSAGFSSHLDLKGLALSEGSD